MGRTHNPDYFKVGGGTAGSGTSGEGGFAQNRARLAAEQARLRREAPHADRPQGKPAKAPRPPASGRIQAPRHEQQRPAERSARPKQPPVAVEAMHLDKPRHGKKRRSAKKRHEVAVLHEMQAHHAGVMEDQRPPAPVADLRDRRLRRDRPEDHGPDTLPPKMQGFVERTLDLGREAAMLVWELATAPITVARLLARMREREA